MSTDNKKIEVMESILNQNDQIADETNHWLTEKGLFAINVMGAPGAGKTSVITSLIEQLQGVNCCVVEGDIESDLDTRKLRTLGIKTVQINTHGACHLDAPTISKEIETLEVQESGVLFIENIGNLVCPAEFQIGEHVKMLIVTVTEGSDKPYKYPLAFEKADIILINKTDLISYVDFDEEYFIDGIRALNPRALIVKTSSVQKKGFEEVVKWIKKKAEALRL